MANNEREYDKDMQTGRPCKDAQMHALKKAHGTPTRQSELPPYISKFAIPADPRREGAMPVDPRRETD